MSPGATHNSHPGSSTLSFKGLTSAHLLHNAGRDIAYPHKTFPSLGPAVVFVAELPPNLRGLRASPFLSREDANHFRHSSLQALLISDKAEDCMEALAWSDKTRDVRRQK